MPFYRYSGTDKTGAPVSGAVDAKSADDAMLQLVKSGLSISQLMMATNLAQAPAPGSGAEPLRRAAPTPGPPVPAPATTKAPVTGINRTKNGTDKDMMLLFSQLAKQLKAGIGPAAALDDLKLRVPKHLSQSLEDASKAATGGGSISDAFEKYPDLYTESIVGTMRAGEQGGFLEEACEILSDQSQNAHNFGRSFWWVRPLALNAVISLPLVFLVMMGLIKAWEIVDGQGEEANSASSLGALAIGIFHELLWPVGPITLVMYAFLYWIYQKMASAEWKMKRHELALRWPVFGPRTRHECLAVFSWVMARLAKSGVSPNRSWELATATVPNHAVRAKLERVGKALGSSERLSDAVFKEDIFPPEYAPLIATGEQTGDMPGAFNQLAKISQSEFDIAQTEAKLKSKSWGSAGCLLVGGLMMIILSAVFYYGLLPAILKGLD
jgi:type II secretory pathway component PulF